MNNYEDDKYDNDFSDKSFFLLIKLENNTYCIPFSNLIKIISQTKITPIPAVPSYIKGLINYKGELVPLIDIKNMLNIPKLGIGDEQNIAIIKNSTGDIFLAFNFDSKGDIVSIEKEKIYINNDIDENNVFLGEFILHNYDNKDDVITILDVDKFIKKFSQNKDL